MSSVTDSYILFFFIVSVRKDFGALLKIGCNCNTAKSVPTVGRNLRF